MGTDDKQWRDCRGEIELRSSIAPVVSHAGFNSLEILRVVIGPK